MINYPIINNNSNNNNNSNSNCIRASNIFYIFFFASAFLKHVAYLDLGHLGMSLSNVLILHFSMIKIKLNLHIIKLQHLLPIQTLNLPNFQTIVSLISKNTNFHLFTCLFRGANVVRYSATYSAKKHHHQRL